MNQSTIELAGICKLLGRLWLHELDVETMTAMRADSFRLPYEDLGGSVPNVVSDSVVESLAVEYCELLIGPKGHLSPIQSVWVESQLQSEMSSSMHRFFELLPDFEFGGDFPDHLGVQLEFAGALLSQTDPAVSEILVLFVPKHLNWASRMLDGVAGRAGSGFYQGLAVVTAALIRSLGESAATS
ncbi:MAG: molecular chaperone TorD family protein [Mariniblastus sp.]|nr:molecular chaperone TorD family protein [Mariniblastus sp.]